MSAVEYMFLDGIIAAARTVQQLDIIASEAAVAGVLTVDYRTGELSRTLYLDANLTTLIVIPPSLRIAKTAVMFRLFLQHPDPGGFTIGAWSGFAGYFGSLPVISTTDNARDVMAMTYDNGAYGGLWGMFTQGTPV